MRGCLISGLRHERGLENEEGLALFGRDGERERGYQHEWRANWLLA